MSSQLVVQSTILAAAATAGAAFVALVCRWRGAVGSNRHEESPAPPERKTRDEGMGARALALDAISEAVLIVRCDGRVRDCNSAALALFQRHRASIEDVFVPSLRALDEDRVDVYQVARERGLWHGEGWVRLPDGAVILCTARVVPLVDGAGQVVGYAEAFRDAVSERLATQDLRDRLFGVHQTSEEGTDRDRAQAALTRLGESFRDLEQAMQHYESVVSTLRVHDPLTESVAGMVHENLEAGAAADTQTLLREVPQLLARLRTRLSRLERVGTR